MFWLRCRERGKKDQVVVPERPTRRKTYEQEMYDLKIAEEFDAL